MPNPPIPVNAAWLFARSRSLPVAVASALVVSCIMLSPIVDLSIPIGLDAGSADGQVPARALGMALLTISLMPLLDRPCARLEASSNRRMLRLHCALAAGFVVVLVLCVAGGAALLSADWMSLARNILLFSSLSLVLADRLKGLSWTASLLWGAVSIMWGGTSAHDLAWWAVPVAEGSSSSLLVGTLLFPLAVWRYAVAEDHQVNR